MKNILITGIGGPTPRSIAKTLRKTHPDFKIIGIDCNPKAIGFFVPGLIDKHFVSPHISDRLYWTFIQDLIIAEGIDAAFVQPEIEVIGWGNYFKNKKWFPCNVLIPPVELSEVLMNKAHMAAILCNSEFIPRTIKIDQDNIDLGEVEQKIGFPCWIRASQGSGGFGSLKVENRDNLKSWLLINKEIYEFTISEYLPGRHLATQMLYFNGKFLRGASLECVEYVMASVAPSRVTGNTSFGRFLNEDKILDFCDSCIKYICTKLNVEAHGVLSFDLKEDNSGKLKVTEVNIRHMAYTGIMADAGFNLVDDTIWLLKGRSEKFDDSKRLFRFEKPYVFLRDVDSEPVILESENEFNMVS